MTEQDARIIFNNSDDAAPFEADGLPVRLVLGKLVCETEWNMIFESYCIPADKELYDIADKDLSKYAGSEWGFGKYWKDFCPIPSDDVNDNPWM
jgi:hypothetical protein